jgi:hypothetical protein
MTLVEVINGGSKVIPKSPVTGLVGAPPAQ